MIGTKPDHKNKMNKNEFLAMKDTKGADRAAQILLQTQSMTALRELKRSINTLVKTLYGEDVKRLPLEEIGKAVEKAAYLIVD